MARSSPLPPINRALRVSRRSLLLAAPAVALALGIGRANAQATRFRFNLGWRVDAAPAGPLLASERGYFREEGIDLRCLADRRRRSRRQRVSLEPSRIAAGICPQNAARCLRVVEKGFHFR